MHCSYRLVENTLASLGMALLVLSLALLPGSRVAGDFGCGGGGECDVGYVCENEVCVFEGVCSNSGCSNIPACGAAVFPGCGAGSCNKTADCTAVPCICRLITFWAVCECTT